jgi:hypothetical protein
MRTDSVIIKGAIIYLPGWPSKHSLSDLQFAPGTAVRITVPTGFYWVPCRDGRIEVKPRWWRKLKFRLTGKWW